MACDARIQCRLPVLYVLGMGHISYARVVEDVLGVKVSVWVGRLGGYALSFGDPIIPPL